MRRLSLRDKHIVVGRLDEALEPIMNDLMTWWDVDHDEAVKIVHNMFDFTNVHQRDCFLKNGKLPAMPAKWNHL